MATPAWSAASSGGVASSGQINQFLGTHAITYCYAGTVQSSQLTAGSGGISTSSSTLAQQFTTGGSQTSVSRVTINVQDIGTGADVTVAISTAKTGGTILASTTLPTDFYSGATTISVPLPCTVSTSTTYYIQVGPGGNGTNACQWNKSNQSSGGFVNGTTEAYGFLFAVYAGATGYLTNTFEDAGARWTWLTYNTSGATVNLPSAVYEYTTGTLRSVRALTYTNGLLTGVA